MLREVTMSLVLRSDHTMAGYKLLPVRQSCKNIIIITHKVTTSPTHTTTVSLWLVIPMLTMSAGSTDNFFSMSTVLLMQVMEESNNS
jgi:hypothetical protein